MYSTITRLPPRPVCLFGVTAAILPMLRALRERFRKSRNRDGVNAITKMLRTGSRVASARTGRGRSRGTLVGRRTDGDGGHGGQGGGSPAVGLGSVLERRVQPPTLARRISATRAGCS